jgi:hypothetical protein
VRSKRRRIFLEEQEIDPLAGLANLLDVMLVFCVGLMVALVLSWNLQSVIFVNVERGREIKDLPQLQETGGQGYHERGKVYQDPETGKLILIEEVPADN